MILFVDDDPFLLAGLRRSLPSKYGIETAGSGKEGLEKIVKNGPYAVIVSDMDMPEMNGVAFLKEAHAIAPETIKLVLSGHGRREQVIEIVNEAKIFRYLEKPVPPDQLIQALDSAVQMYLRNCQDRHSSNLQTTSYLEFGNEIAPAILNNEMFLEYQPQIELSTGTVRGAEALIRWRRPVSGIVPPSDFIPIAEVNGAVVPLTHWLLRKVCSDLLAWQRDGLPIKAAVNISTAHFEDLDLSNFIREILAETGLDPSRLELEITETVLTDSMERIRDCLNDISATGVSIALDDFGSGFMRFSYFQELPVSKLKIDGNYIQQMEDDKTCAAIVNSLVTAGLSMGITIVAEAVETENQAQILRDMGCHLGQGYHYSRPISHEALRNWIRDRSMQGTTDSALNSGSGVQATPVFNCIPDKG